MSTLFPTPTLPDVPDPAPAERLAAGVLALASHLADTSRRLATADADWEGTAADSFRAARTLQAARFADAAHALVGAVRALTAYADALRDIQGQVDSARSAPGVVDQDAAARRASSDLAAAQAACCDALRRVAAEAPRPRARTPAAASRPNWFHRALGIVFTPPMQMPDSVRADDGLTGLFGGIGGAFMTVVDQVEQPWTEIPYLSGAIRRAGGVEEPAAPSGRYRLGELAFDVGTAGVGAEPEAVEVAAEEVGQRALLHVKVPGEAFDLGVAPEGAWRRRAWMIQVAQRISHGHSYPKHVLGVDNPNGADFPWVRSENELRRHIVRIMRTGEHRTKVYEFRPRGAKAPQTVVKHGFWKDGDLVLFNPKDRQGDLGTAFSPYAGYRYFERHFPR